MGCKYTDKDSWTGIFLWALEVFLITCERKMALTIAMQTVCVCLFPLHLNAKLDSGAHYTIWFRNTVYTQDARAITAGPAHGKTSSLPLHNTALKWIYCIHIPAFLFTEPLFSCIFPMVPRVFSFGHVPVGCLFCDHCCLAPAWPQRSEAGGNPFLSPQTSYRAGLISGAMWERACP